MSQTKSRELKPELVRRPKARYLPSRLNAGLLTFTPFALTSAGSAVVAAVAKPLSGRNTSFVSNGVAAGADSKTTTPNDVATAGLANRRVGSASVDAPVAFCTVMRPGGSAGGVLDAKRQAVRPERPTGRMVRPAAVESPPPARTTRCRNGPVGNFVTSVSVNELWRA